MTIIKILQLLRKHLVLLILIPLIMAIFVVYSTRKPVYEYSSATTLYTGIASGSTVEMDKSLSFFATNTAFDNLINVINSRETQQEVAIRLLAQHLLLEKYDSKFISRQSFIDLRRITPDNINKLIVKEGNLIQNKNNKSTQNEKSKIKGQASPDSSNKTFSFSSLDTTDNQLQPASINKAAYEQTIENLTAFMAGSDSNFVYKLLYFNHPHYSLNAISKARVKRIGTSDLVKIEYDSDDPGICQQTLLILTEVCIKNYKLVKENRSDAVIKYFEYQVSQASARLKVGEDQLLKFNEDHNIINYYEQSKAVAIVKENLDVSYHEMRIKLAGTEAAIKRIEEKLGNQKQVQLNNATIIEKRKQLGEINGKIANIETIGASDSIDERDLPALKIKADKLKDEMRNAVNSLYSYGNTTEGLPVSSLLSDWLANVIVYEDTKAGIEVLGLRIIEFQKQYAIYAPAGANLKRIEREINVSEQEFLSVLSGLNLAKLKMQDAELSSTIKAVDPPFFPLSPNPTKRKMLVFAAALIGFLIVLSTIVATEYFDETLKNPVIATKIIGLKTFGVFPKVYLKTGSLNFLFVSNRLLEIAIQQIDLITANKTDLNEPRTLVFFSSLSNEGKTISAGNIAWKLKMQGKKVLSLNYSRESLSHAETSQIGYPADYKHESTVNFAHSGTSSQFFRRLLGYSDNRINLSSPFLQKTENFLNTAECIKYNINAEYYSTGSIDQLVEKHTVSSGYKPDYIIVEIPPILYYSVPPQLIASADLTILVCRANRIWSSADQGALDMLRKITSHEPVIFINGVELLVIESVLGDLPKKRSRARRIFKKIVRFQFFTRNQL
ncbi:MAG: hypothetical protein Q7U54_07365 [Bacteroidales bacterium]|nr:hypothetical protein [Bacteroidales bacterium]